MHVHVNIWLQVFNKRLLDEEITVIMEILRRYTEIQHVTLRKCYLTDETLEKLMPLLVDLRHLRTLCLSQNALTSATAMAVHHNFSHKKRRILNLDMRENVLNEHDGQMIYHSFHAGMYMYICVYACMYTYCVLAHLCRLLTRQ